MNQATEKQEAGEAKETGLSLLLFSVYYQCLDILKSLSG